MNQGQTSFKGSMSADDEMFLLVAETGEILYWSENLRCALGYKNDDRLISASEIATGLVPDLESISGSGEKKAPQATEYRAVSCRAKDGSTFNAWVKSAPIRIKRQILYLLFIRFTKLTESESTLAALPQSLTTFLDQFSAAACLYGGSRLLYANPSCFQLFGCQESDDSNRAMLSELVEPCWKQVRAAQCLEVNNQTEFEGLGIKHNGSTFPFRAEVIPVTLAGGNGTVVLLTDMTEENLITAEIRRLTAFIQSNPSPMLELTADGKVIYFNEAARSLVETSDRKTPLGLLPLDSQTLAEDCIATGQTRYRYENLNDGRTILWSFVSIPDRKTVHCFGRFVTENEPAAKGELPMIDSKPFAQWARGIAHELNNILTLIQSHASFLMTEKQLDAESKESTQQIYSAVDRAACLTDKLFSLGKKDS